MTTKIFFVLSVLLLGLTGLSTYQDQASRDYIAIQIQYQKDHPGTTFQVETQQLFPGFAAASIGTQPRVERCISCHVPDIGQIGPQAAAQNIVTDFYKYAPNAQQLAQEYHLTYTHPAFVNQGYYNEFGPNAYLTFQVTDPTTKQPTIVKLPGYLPSFLDPSTATTTGGYGIDQIGCVVCHNGNRQALDETDAHQNLIVNPEYSWSEGAALYYTNCAVCHGLAGGGGVGPPLNNQDRLGFFNEDYYYRCIDFGFTDFEHYGSVMPNWSGTVPVDYPGAAASGAKSPPLTTGGLDASSPQQNNWDIDILVQFIRHWENYSTLP